MSTRRPARPPRFTAAVLFASLAAAVVPAQEPRFDTEPILRLDPPGTRARLRALAFEPGGALLATGHDKVVHRYARGRTGDLRPEPAGTLRVPVGTEMFGTLYALAVSPDGNWIAAGGVGLPGSGRGRFRLDGVMLPGTDETLSDRQLAEVGVIHLFHRPTGRVTKLVGHTGQVAALAFVDGDSPADGPPRLVSAGVEERVVGNGNRVPGDGYRVRDTLRLWDAATGEPLAVGTVGSVRTDADETAEARPVLAAWAVPGTDAVHVAAAWRGENLWRWAADGAAADPPRPTPVPLCLTVARDPGRDAVLVGGFFGGRPAVRRLPFDGDGQAGETVLALPVGEFPIDLFLTGGGNAVPARRPRVGVLTVRPAGAVRNYALRLSAAGGALPAPVPLWSGPASDPLPVLAVQPDGDQLAVGPDPTGGIRVLRTADPTATPERLRPPGVGVEKVRFVRDGGKLGLQLTVEADVSAPGDAVPPAVTFDLNDGVLLPPGTDAGWTKDSADLAGWAASGPTRVNGGGTDRLTYRYVPPGRAAVTVVVTAAAGSTPVGAVHPAVPGAGGAGETAPLAAIGYVMPGGVPVLELFDLTTGERVRRLSGHDDRIRSVAFGADGRLLVTSSADRTVSLWWLPDLAETIGVTGLLRGLVLAEERDAAGVERFVLQDFTDEADPALVRALGGEAAVGKLVVRGLVARDAAGAAQPETFDSPRHLHVAAGRTAPGGTVVLRVAERNAAGGTGADRDVTVPVGQLVDERKPVLSFYFSGPGEGEVDPVAPDARRRPGPPITGWVAWNPLGPFESSDREIERELGWHFNPNLPNAADPNAAGPAAVAPAAAPPNPNAPDAADGGVRFADLGEYREDFFGRGLIGEVLRTGEVPDVWPPPVVPDVSLRLRDRRGQPLPVDPARPLLATPPESLLVRVDRLPVSRVAGVTLAVDGGAAAAVPASDLDRGLWVADVADQPLVPGEHELTVTVTAAGRGGRPGSATTRSLTVVIPAPRVPVAAVRPAVVRAPPVARVDAPDGGGLPYEPDAEPRPVVGPVVPVEPPAVAAVPPRGPVEAVRPERIPPAPLPSLLVRTPRGRTVITGDAGEPPRVVEFAAEVIAVPPRGDGRPAEPATVELWLNGRPVGPRGRFTVGPGDVNRTLRVADVPAVRGANELSLRVRRGNLTAVLGPVTVERRVVPVVASLTGPAAVPFGGPGSRAADLHAVVRAPEPPRTEDVSVDVNGGAVDPASVRIAAGPEPGTWTVALTGVPLPAEKNAVAVAVRGPDGPAAAPGRHVVTRPGPPPVPPIVTFESLPTRTTESSLEVVVIVESDVRPERVELEVNGASVALPVDRAVAAGGDRYAFRRTVELEATNTLRAVVTGPRGGVGRAEARVAVIDPPVRVVIDRVATARGRRGVDLLAPGAAGVSAGGGPATVSAAPGAEVWVEGRVLFPPGNPPPGNPPPGNPPPGNPPPGDPPPGSSRVGDPPGDDSVPVEDVYARGWVNGFLQNSVRAEPPDELTRQRSGGRFDVAGTALWFGTRVLLDRAEGNAVRIDVAGPPQSRGGAARFTIDCAAPNDNRTLWLLIAGVDVPRDERDVFRGRVHEALQLSRSGNAWWTRSGWPVSPLTDRIGYFESVDLASSVLDFLDGTSNSAEPATDLLLVYFAGPEAATADGRNFVLATAEHKHYGIDPATDEHAVTSEWLSDRLADAPGAHLLMLDVVPMDGGPPADPLPAESRLGVLRNVWLGEGALPPELTLALALRDSGDDFGRLGRLIELIDARTVGDDVRFDHRLSDELHELNFGVVD